MAQRTVPANELAIKALQCPEGKSRVVYHIDGHGNEGLKLYVESSGTKTWYFRARVRGSGPKDMPLGRWPAVTIGEARKRKSAIVASISDGKALFGDHVATREAIDFIGHRREEYRPQWRVLQSRRTEPTVMTHGKDGLRSAAAKRALHSTRRLPSGLRQSRVTSALATRTNSATQ
jgi:hypothetical protein